MTGSPSTPGTAEQSVQADLLAKTMNITADYGAGLVYVFAVCENLGPGSAHGPFIISVEVSFGPPGLPRGEVTSYVENFPVPADVILHGPPVFEPVPTLLQAESVAPARPIDPIGIGSPFQTQYVTGRMGVPLHFRDGDPPTVYGATFQVDPYYEVPDHNRTNNMFTWGTPLQPTFCFYSLEARERQGPFVIEGT